MYYILYFNGKMEIDNVSVSHAMDRAKQIAQAERCVVQVTNKYGDFVVGYNGENL